MENWLRIAKFSNFLDDKNLNAEIIKRTNHDQNDISLENRLGFGKVMTVQSCLSL